MKFLPLYIIYIFSYKDDLKLYIWIYVCQHVLLFIYVCIYIIIITFIFISSFYDFYTNSFQGIINYEHSKKQV